MAKNRRQSHPKMGGQHTTTVTAGEIVIKAIRDLACVTKFVPSFITNSRSGKKILKFFEIPAGLKVKAGAEGECQMIYIYTTDREKTKATILENWPA